MVRGKSSSAPEPRPGFANSQTEGSGLIDIRAMAASTLAASPSPSGPSGGRSDDLPGLGSAPVFSPMAAPILMPAAPSGPPKWMWAILGVGVMAVLGIVVVGILLLTRKPEQPVVAALPPGSAAAAPQDRCAGGGGGGQSGATAGTPAATGTPAAAAAGTPSAPVAQNDKGEEKKHSGKSLAEGARHQARQGGDRAGGEERAGRGQGGSAGGACPEEGQA